LAKFFQYFPPRVLRRKSFLPQRPYRKLIMDNVKNAKLSIS
jgi:hypothetical protein